MQLYNSLQNRKGKNGKSKKNVEVNTMKIDPNTISVNYVKKEPFTGGYNGMRYRLMKAGDGMEVTIWPEPYSYFKTPEEKKQSKMFPLSVEGRDAAVEWMNEQYEEQKQLWDLALHTAWTIQ